MPRRYRTLQKAARDLAHEIWPLVVRHARKNRAVDLPRVMDEYRNSFARFSRWERAQRRKAAEREEAEMSLAAFLATRLAGQLRCRKLAKRPGGQMTRRLPGETDPWQRAAQSYFTQCLAVAGFPDATIPALVEPLLTRPRRLPPVKQAREITARAFALSRGKRFLPRTIRDYQQGVKVLDSAARCLEDPRVVRQLLEGHREETENLSRSGRPIGMQLAGFLEMTSENPSGSPVRISDPADPRWLPRVLFGYVPPQLGPSKSFFSVRKKKAPAS